MSDTVKQPETLDDIRTLLWEQYGGENKRITDADYDRTLAVKCINGTFVGRKTENVVMYRGIPYVGRQPGRLASMKVVFSDEYEEPNYMDSDADRLYSEIEKDVMETIK